MNFLQYDAVRIKRLPLSVTIASDVFNLRPPRVGDVACIVDIYANPPGYELECSDADGITQWLVAFAPDEVELECLECNVLTGCQFRYFFDPGAGTCLWSANDRARARFGYPAVLADLCLPPEVASHADELIARFDTSIDWSNPAGPSPWTEDEREGFMRDTAALHESLRAFLGSSVTIIDESSRRQ